MHRPNARFASTVITIVWLLRADATPTSAQAGPAAPVHVLKISSGPSGSSANGDFALTSERSIFNRTDDREVLVLFQWDGVPGPHRLIAQWRSPDSAVSSTSAIDYVAKAARFGAYWSLPLSPSMTLGTWSIEATVDGVPAGRLTFEVGDNKIASPASKPLLAPAELYERLSRAYVALRRSSKGRELGPAAGFSPAHGTIYTAMAVLDNADDIRVVSLSGAVTPVTAALAWNRREQWAVLSAPGAAGSDALPLAAQGATRVGTRCASLEGAAAGRVLRECTITGEAAAGAAAGLIATFFDGRGTPGAPVVNEFGEVIGLVGDPSRTGESAMAYSLGGTIPGTPIVPISLVAASASATPTALADLRSRGVTVPGVAGEEHISTAGFGQLNAKGKLAAPENHHELPLREKGFAIFITWSPKERLKGQMSVRLFDAENTMIAEGKTEKVDFRKGQTTTSSWSLTMVEKSGTYRADVFLDATPIWRGFVRITP